MKVFIVTQGCYSDYHICGVAIDRERAEKIALICSNDYYPAEVEEYEADDYGALISGKTAYCVTFRENGVSVKEDHSLSGIKLGVSEAFQDGDFIILDVYLYADDEHQAIKIASDMKAKYVSEKIGL